MIEMIPYRAEHVLSLVGQSINANIENSYREYLADFLEEQGGGATITQDGVPMACGGVLKLWEGRGSVWTVFNEHSKNCFVPVFRNIKRYIRSSANNYRRLELAVPLDFDIGHRRALLLGFKIETPLARKYLPTGEDCVLYSFIQEGA
jgi:hypothetical protein